MSKFSFSDLKVPVDPNAPTPGSVWQHTNGNIYRVIFVTNLGARREGHPPDVVYAGRNGNIWSRPASDWSRSMTLLAEGGNGDAD